MQVSQWRLNNKSTCFYYVGNVDMETVFETAVG